MKQSIDRSIDSQSIDCPRSLSSILFQLKLIFSKWLTSDIKHAPDHCNSESIQHNHKGENIMIITTMITIMKIKIIIIINEDNE